MFNIDKILKIGIFMDIKINTIKTSDQIWSNCKDETSDHKVAYTVIWLVRYTNHQNFILCKFSVIYFCKVWRRLNICIIQYYWLIALYIFILLVSNMKILIKKSCVRVELSDFIIFYQIIRKISYQIVKKK